MLAPFRRGRNWFACSADQMRLLKSPVIFCVKIFVFGPIKSFLNSTNLRKLTGKYNTQDYSLELAKRFLLQYHWTKARRISTAISAM